MFAVPWLTPPNADMTTIRTLSKKCMEPERTAVHPQLGAGNAVQMSANKQTVLPETLDDSSTHHSWRRRCAELHYKFWMAIRTFTVNLCWGTGEYVIHGSTVTTNFSRMTFFMLRDTRSRFLPKLIADPLSTTCDIYTFTHFQLQLSDNPFLKGLHFYLACCEIMQKNHYSN